MALRICLSPLLRKLILDRGFGASTCLNSDRGVLPASDKEDLFYKKQPRVSRKFVSSQCSEACLAVTRRWPSGTAAQRPSGMSHAGIRAIKQPQADAARGGAHKPHTVSSLEAPPIRHPNKWGILQFLIKLLLIKFRSSFSTQHSLSLSSRDYLLVSSF